MFVLKLVSLNTAMFLFLLMLCLCKLYFFLLSERLYFLMFNSKILQEEILFAVGCFSSTAIRIKTYYDACIFRPIHSFLVVRNLSVFSLLTFSSNLL